MMVVDSKLQEVFDKIDNRTPEEQSEMDAKWRETEEGKRFTQLRNDCWQHILAKQDDYATERIVEHIEAANNIYTTRDDVKSEIWMYDDGIYKPNGESYIREFARRILLHAYTPQRANKVIAKIEADTMIDADKFFNVNYVDEMPMQNGILNIRTRELSEFNPQKIFFNKLPITYDSSATCENIQKFFEDILKESDDVNVAYELFGYSLLKDHPVEKAFMFIGNGRNGKGKFISLMKAFLGAENCCSVPLNQLRSDSTGVCELFGKLVNMAGDLNNTALKETGLFKGITGRDMVGAKRKYLRDLFFVNYSKQIFACNELPRVYDFSAGFWSRWVLLEFPYQFIEKHEYDSLEDKANFKIRDTEIIDKLTTDKQMSGLLNAALDGLDRVIANQDISSSKGTAETKNFWIRNSDSFSAYCLDMIEEDYEGFVSKKELRSSFMKYCKLHKIKGASDKGMKVVMEDMFGAIESRKWDGTNQEYGYEGVKFKQNPKISQISVEIPKVIEKKIPSTSSNLTLIQLKSNKRETYDEITREVAKKLRATQEYKKWKYNVDMKFNKCNECGDEWQVRETHHIKSIYDILKDENIKTVEDGLKSKTLFDVNNGESLCCECHRKKHNHFKDFTKEEIESAGYTTEEYQALLNSDTKDEK